MVQLHLKLPLRLVAVHHHVFPLPLRLVQYSMVLHLSMVLLLLKAPHYLVLFVALHHPMVLLLLIVLLPLKIHNH